MASSMSAWLKLILPAILLRCLLLPLQLYRSTDFEVHRNWLAITYQLPISEWYFESTSPWTLDYPPAFAYFEWVLSQVAAMVDPAMLQVQNLDYASTATVLFQRCSVIVGDVVLLLGAYSLGGAQSSALVLWNSTLLLVDHVHFQYNGMLLGILLLSIACLETGRTYLGALLFCLLLCMKHIFLYVSPVFFVYLLRFHCHLKFRPFKLDLGALLRLAFVVLGTFIACLLPIFWTGKPLETLLQLLRRLFPFGRGLTHAYWAPNAWAFYNTLDRVLAKVVGVSGGGSTAGFAEVYESAVLWTVPPKATFVLTLLAYCPLLWKIWQAKDRHGLAIYVTLGSAIAFTFGWHVHEKAILMVTIPFLAALPALPHDWDSIPLRHCAVGLSTVACFSVMPLLPLTPLETALKWILFAAGLLVEEVLLGSKAVSLKMLGVGFLPWQLVVLGYCLLGLYRDAGGHQLLFRQRMEFLPLLLTSDFSAMLVLQFFWSIFRLLPSGKSVKTQ